MLLARRLVAAALIGGTAAAGAQTPLQKSGERAAALPPYRSAFEGYRPYADEPLAPWREVNDTVGRVGGHVGMLRAEESVARERAAPPKEEGHDAHHRK
jgi:hypothetical protein